MVALIAYRLDVVGISSTMRSTCGAQYASIHYKYIDYICIYMFALRILNTRLFTVFISYIHCERERERVQVCMYVEPYAFVTQKECQ